MPKLYEAIEKAVGNGVPVNLIGDALVRQGWPPELVKQALEAWLTTYGRQTKTTAFKDWLARYYKKARGAVVLVVFIGTIQAGVALLKPWPTKILADSAFGKITAPGPLAPYTHTPTLILIRL